MGSNLRKLRRTASRSVFERFADPMGMDGMLKDINNFGARDQEDELANRIEEVEVAFAQGEIDEETYGDFMRKFGAIENEAGLI